MTAPGEQDAAGEGGSGPRLVPAAPRERERHRGRGDQPAGDAGERGAAAGAEPAGRHVADQREARDQDHQQPELVGVERVPRIERPIRQQRQDDEGRDQQADAGIDVVPAQFRHQPVQRLLVGEGSRGHDPQPDRELAVPKHGHGAEEEDRDRGDLGGQAERAILGAGDQPVAGEDQRRYR
jgi:hypothetical protein